MPFYYLEKIMKYDYSTYIESLGGTVVCEYSKHIVCEYEGFLFKAYKTTIKARTFSFEGNFRACEDKENYFKHYMEKHCKHKNLSFSNSVFVGVREHVVVNCKEHGEFVTIPYLLIDRGSGCSKCYDKYKRSKAKNKGIDRFIEEATLRFDGKFDYSKTIYKNIMTPVDIICPTHGLFQQTPNEHLQSTYACKRCYRIYNSFKPEDYAKICPNGSNLYVVELISKEEKFYKVGISKDIDRRFKRYKYAGFYIGDNIILFNKDAALVSLLEDDVLRDYQHYKYVPKADFKGKTECFSYVDIEDVSEMFYTITRLGYEMERLCLD